MKIIRGILVAAFACGPLCAKAAERQIGGWRVSVEPDRFAKHAKGAPPPARVIVMTLQRGNSLAIRCIENRLSIVLVDAERDRYTKGGEVRYAFQAGRGDIVRGFGTALDGSAVELIVRGGMVSEMTSAPDAAFRINSGGVEFERTFSLKGAKQAFAPLDEECVLD
ncbi:hypothetical protein [Bradyrhizobium sp. SZCCHNR3003]|uniref:hypothetical protein n=1 Tax=Bradyrhizobium sp. SZCCHNR3003 TaxID=3057387 RepID=UPI002916A4E6|nr:hypothetical protein [Bradyrhizobium sp. SZCCHNR3003]